MMREKPGPFFKTCFLAAAMLLAVPPLVADPQPRDRPLWTFHLELDQMLCLKPGAERRIAPAWGLKGAAGITFAGHISYDLVGIRHFRAPDRTFQLDLEFGLPVAYVNFIEGVAADWDPVIDGPYAGWGPGFSLVWGRRFRAGRLGLKTGLFCVFEYQRDSGWRDPAFLPEIAIEWVFSRSGGGR